MAEWSSVERYVHENYEVASHEGNWMTMHFTMDNGASRILMMTRAGGLIQFVSPFASREHVSMDQVFAAIRAEGIVLGITCADPMLLVTHSQVLETVDEEEVDAGIQLVVNASDLLATRLAAGARDRGKGF